MRSPRWHALELLVTGCLSTPPGSVAPGDDAAAIDAGLCARADWADAAPPSTPDEVGNVLSLDFDEPDSAYMFRDRSGWRRDAGRIVGATGPGKHGTALVSGPNSYAVVADDGFELGRNLTIAAWIYLVTGVGNSVVLSDHNGTSAEYDLHVDSTGRLVFFTTAGGSNKSFVGSPLISTGEWFHVAVTWSDDTVTFFVNGNPDTSDNGFVDPPEVHQAPFIIGRRGDDMARLDGLIDDVRVWDRALTLVEIDAAMGVADLEQRCGDGVIQLAESCEQGDPCCSDCAQMNAGCGEAGCGEDGACVTDCGRPTRGLVALYRFDEGEGGMVRDASGVDPALDLELEPAASYRWTGDGLELTGAAAGSPSTAKKVIDAIEASGEFTFDVWLTPGDEIADELLRLISLENGARDFILGVFNASYVARFGVDSVQPATGHPSLEAFDRVQLGRLTHLVSTRSADGTRRLYVDGSLRNESRAPGVLGWGESRLLVGDAPSGGHAFVGTLHRVAIHSVALDPIEVAASFHAGSR